MRVDRLVAAEGQGGRKGYHISVWLVQTFSAWLCMSEESQFRSSE